MNTVNNTVRGHAAADTVHALSSTNTNTNNNNPPAAANGAIQDAMPPTTVESPPANANEGKVGDISKTLASLPQPIIPKPPRPFNVADYDEGEDAKLKNEAKQAIAAASSNLSEVDASLPQPILPKPPRPFNAAKFDEGEDAKLKNEATQVGASKSKDSIIVPTEEDIVDGVALDPAISRERRTNGGEGEAADLELGDNVEPLQSKDEESEGSSQDEVAPFNSELPVLEAYIVEEESRRDVVMATHVEPILPWWKQRRFKLFLSVMFVVFAVMAIALGVSMSSSSSGGEPEVIMVDNTSAPSKSLVPTSIPSVSLRPSLRPSLSPSLRPSVHPSFSPTTTSSPTFEHFLESSKIVADDDAAYDLFGSSVAVFGDTLVVGAPKDDTDKGEDSGSAHIYNRDPITKEWILQQKLVADDGAANDEFGYRVAIYGTTVIVGAPGDNEGKHIGSAYIYHRDPETKEWILQQKLVPDDGEGGDFFGYSVSIHNSTVVVGTFGDDTDKGENSGSAYIYQQDFETNEWILQQKLEPDDGAAGHQFGLSVAIFGDTLVVGALSGIVVMGASSGSAYIYNRDPGTKEWVLQQKLEPDDAAADLFFGESVDVYYGTVVVGSPYDTGWIGFGSVYIYHQGPETKEWIFQQELVPYDGAFGDWFGQNVDIYEDALVVGSYGNDSGSAYIYRQDPEAKEWIIQQKLLPDDGAAGDRFGLSVAIYNNTVFVGADGDQSAYIYHKDPN